MSRKAVGLKEARSIAEASTLAQLRTLIATDQRPETAASRLNPMVTVARASSIFLAVLDATNEDSWRPRYERDPYGKWRMNGQLLIASNIVREFGRPKSIGGGE